MSDTTIIYANSYLVNYQEGEFYIELTVNTPQGPKNTASIFMPPIKAKGLLKALKMMMDEYEKEFGALPEPKITREKLEEEKGRPPSYG